MLLLVCYLPKSHFDRITEAIFSAGAGRIGQYQRCLFRTLGEGRFSPQDGSDPFFGKNGKDNCVQEYRIEVLCREEIVGRISQAILRVHPYQEPIFFFQKIGNHTFSSQA